MPHCWQVSSNQHCSNKLINFTYGPVAGVLTTVAIDHLAASVANLSRPYALDTPGALLVTADARQLLSDTSSGGLSAINAPAATAVMALCIAAAMATAPGGAFALHMPHAAHPLILCCAALLGRRFASVELCRYVTPCCNTRPPLVLPARHKTAPRRRSAHADGHSRSGYITLSGVSRVRRPPLAVQAQPHPSLPERTL